jgi:23S rRNA pseudouridine2604 synthase
MDYPIRINKYLRDTGLASRREADRLVEGGLVFINGKRAENGMQVKEGDEVTVKGKRKQYRYLAYHKQAGQTMQKLTKWEEKGMHPAGELDKEAEGLMILTDDGRLARAIASSDPKYEKEYVVEVKEQLRAGIPDIFEKGMETESLGKLPSVKAELINKHTLRIFLTEERHHQIRIMLSELHYTISSLKRVRIGDIRLGDLKPGLARSLTL